MEPLPFPVALQMAQITGYRGYMTDPFWVREGFAKYNKKIPGNCSFRVKRQL